MYVRGRTRPRRHVGKNDLGASQSRPRGLAVRAPARVVPPGAERRSLLGIRGGEVDSHSATEEVEDVVLMLAGERRSAAPPEVRR